MTDFQNVNVEQSSDKLTLSWKNHRVSFFSVDNKLHYSLKSEDIFLQEASGAIFLKNQKNKLLTLIPKLVHNTLESVEITEYKDNLGSGIQIQFHCIFKSEELDVKIELPCRWRFQILTERTDGIKFVSEPMFLTSQIFLDLIPSEVKSYGLYAYAPLYMKNQGALNLNQKAQYIQKSQNSLNFPNSPNSPIPQKPKPQNPENITFYSNGWQSWSNNYLLTYYDKWPSSPVKLGRINMENQEKRLVGRYQSEYHTVIYNKNSQCSLVLGFLTLKDQFSRVIMDRLQFEGKVKWLCAYSQTDGILLSLLNDGLRKSEKLALSLTSTPEGYDILTEMCRMAGIYASNLKNNRKSQQILTGWCSWYYYYTKVKETDVLSNLEFFSEHPEYPIDLIQLDDGYQTTIGDWGIDNEVFNNKFPHSLRWLVEKIHARSFMAGLWFAPFFMTKKSEFYHKHSDWMLKNRLNRPVSTALNWGANQYAIDLSLSEVREYLTAQTKVISNDWGFDFLKIDFLYASEAIDFIYQQPGFSRAQILRRGLEAIRKGFGDSKIVLGCGCPLGPAVGIVDIMRIGPDTAANWSNNELLFYKIGKVSAPSLKVALKSIIQRSYMHNTWWVNDPDCVVVRENRSQLTIEEVILELTVFGLSGGQILISDDEKKVNRERLDLLNRILPPYSIKLPEVVPLDLFSRSEPTLYAKTVKISGDANPSIRHLVCCINWQKSPTSMTYRIRDLIIYQDQIGYCKEQEFIVFDYWNEKILARKRIDEKIVLSDVPRHGCRYLALVPVSPSHSENPRSALSLPFFISSTIHISQGAMEIKEYKMNIKENIMAIEVSLPGKHAGDLYFLGPKINSKEMEVECNQPISKKTTYFGTLYKIHVYADPKCQIKITWGKNKNK